MDEKKLSNVAQDKQRNGDLAKLTEQGGPFTKKEQVDNFLKRTDCSNKLEVLSEIKFEQIFFEGPLEWLMCKGYWCQIMMKEITKFNYWCFPKLAKKR